MHRVLPAPIVEVDADEAYRAERPVRSGRPWVLANMISTFDGAIEVDGVSGPLGSAGDKEVFGAIRSVADVILVGAATVVAEEYSAPSTSVSTRARRLAQGAWPVARVAVVSASLTFDLGLPLFDRPDQRPIVLTTENADPDRVAEVQERADVVRAGTERVNLGAALAQLGNLGARVVLSEGGPRLNGQLLAGDLIDEFCLSVAPVGVAGDSSRIARGTSAVEPHEFDLVQVLTEDHYLFLRYLRRGRLG